MKRLPPSEGGRETHAAGQLISLKSAGKARLRVGHVLRDLPIIDEQLVGHDPARLRFGQSDQSALVARLRLGDEDGEVDDVTVVDRVLADVIVTLDVAVLLKKPRKTQYQSREMYSYAPLAGAGTADERNETMN